MHILANGTNLAKIITIADQKVSAYLLDGGLEGVEGVRKEYPGSFSEEEDTLLRLTAKKAWQLDPVDGTGDAYATYQTSNLIGPTTLISLIERPDIESDYKPVVGIIFDIFSETVIVSDGKEILLFKADKDEVLKEIRYERTQPLEWEKRQPLRINQRQMYPQHNFDAGFMNYLEEKGIDLVRVPVGGAGTLSMQFLRQYIQPTSDNGQAFNNLKPITIAFNAQPDHKTWDLRPVQVIMRALALPEITNIYGLPLEADERVSELKDMSYRSGYILAPTGNLRETMNNHARGFEHASGKKLTEIDY